ncbi:MAG: hemerythrin domain-containing protein [Betaproteobacteria bacterium]
MTALDMLMDEHRAIEREIDVLLEVAADLEKRAPVPLDTVEALIDFLQRVADGVHHEKEERFLFPMLAEHGVMPDESIVGPLLLQHESGRFHVREMRNALARLEQGAPGAAVDFGHAARAYAELLRAHIQTEDECLYPIAARVLTPADDERLRGAFAELTVLVEKR